MRRIGLAVVLAVLLAPLAAEAQPERSKPRIAVLFAAIPIAEISGPNPKESSMRAFLEGMRAHGWIDGQNITIERRSAEGHDDRFLPLSQEMVNLKVEVLVISGATPFVLAAQQATRTIPIVTAGLGRDPVALGLAKSFASPGGNVTGSTFQGGLGLLSKWLELLKEMSPKISRVAYLYRPGSDGPDTRTEDAARALGITLFWTPIDVSRIAASLAGIAQQQPNALAIGVRAPRLREIIEFAAIHRLPAIYNFRDYVEGTCLHETGPFLT